MLISKLLRQSLVSNAIFYLTPNAAKMGIYQKEILPEQYYPKITFFFLIASWVKDASVGSFLLQ